MKPFNFVALLLFLAGLIWVFTLSEESVRQIQKTYYLAISPIISKGGETEQFAQEFLEEVEHSTVLEKKLEQTARERDRYHRIADQVRNLESENNELRAALDFKRKSEFDVIPAIVIRKQPQLWGQSIEINRGTDDGLGVSLSVLASNGGLAGRVQLSGQEISSVLLITDEGSRVAARVEGSTEFGIVTGRRATHGKEPRLRLLFLSKNAILQKGMKVYTNGRGKLFPANIPIGTIEDFETGPVYGEAELIPAVDFSNLQTVFVITNSPGS